MTWTNRKTTRRYIWNVRVLMDSYMFFLFLHPNPSSTKIMIIKTHFPLVLLLPPDVNRVSYKTKVYFTALLIPPRPCVSLFYRRLAEFMQRREHEATEWSWSCYSQNLLTEIEKCGRCYVAFWMSFLLPFALYFIPCNRFTELLCQDFHFNHDTLIPTHLYTVLFVSLVTNDALLTADYLPLNEKVRWHLWSVMRIWEDVALSYLTVLSQR
jgi:hypothetical protein